MTRPAAPIAVLAFALLPFGAQAQPRSLSDVPEITEGLITAAITYELGRVCGPVDVRRMQGLGFLLSLQAQARSLGFSQEEVEAYVDDRAEKDRLEAIARERLAALGAVPGDEASHCAVARAEIARGSLIGRYLTE